MKIILFGSTGMLGRYVYNVLHREFEIKCITREDFDIETNNWDLLFSILANVEKNDIIINCAGAIPQKTPDIRKYISLISRIFKKK